MEVLLATCNRGWILQDYTVYRRFKAGLGATIQHQCYLNDDSHLVITCFL